MGDGHYKEATHTSREAGERADTILRLKTNAEHVERQAITAREAFDRELEAADEATVKIIVRRLIEQLKEI